MNNKNLKNIKPYIGITGFMKRNEVKAVLDLMPLESKRLLMVGVLANWRTYKGIQTKQSSRHPKIEDIKRIFLPHPLALNLIHYHTNNMEALHEELIELSILGGYNLHGFQLNNTWPPIEELQRYRAVYPNYVIVLAVTKKAFEETNNSSEQLVSRLKEYDGLVNYVLLDASGGLGVPMNTERILEYLRAIRSSNLGAGLVVAGGLGPNTMHLVQPVVKEFPELSIDAEGKLRDQKDNLDLALTGDYLKKSLEMFKVDL